MRRPAILSAPAAQGFRAAMPLWLAAAPVALAYVLAARQAGMSAVDIQAMSLTLYSATAQMAMAQLWAGGASAVTILITAVMLNLHHFIYGLSLTRHIRFTDLEKALAAFGLSDAAYGLTVGVQGQRSAAFLLGAELSLFAAWNVLTATALLAGDLLAALDGLPLDLIAPPVFLALLIPLIQTRVDLAVVIFSVVLAVMCSLAGLGQLAVIVVSIGSPLAGVGMARVRAANGETGS